MIRGLRVARSGDKGWRCPLGDEGGEMGGKREMDEME